jgi:hypothetical protein
MTSLTSLPQLDNVLDHQSSRATAIVGAFHSAPVVIVKRVREIYHFPYDIAREDTPRLPLK